MTRICNAIFNLGLMTSHETSRKLKCVRLGSENSKVVQRLSIELSPDRLFGMV